MSGIDNKVFRSCDVFGNICDIDFHHIVVCQKEFTTVECTAIVTQVRTSVGMDFTAARDKTLLVPQSVNIMQLKAVI